jgi:hypothetical protein
MQAFAIDVIFWIGYFAVLAILLSAVWIIALWFLALISKSKQMPSQIVHNLIVTRLGQTSQEQLDDWIERIREEHRRLTHVNN